MKAHNFASHRARFFHTKTDLQNSQEPHQINVSKKTTSKLIDGNSLPYYQEGRKGGLHPPFRSLRLLISPRFFCALRAPFFIALFGFGQTYQTAIHLFQNHPFFQQAHQLATQI